jgi:hypothetical protein
MKKVISTILVMLLLAGTASNANRRRRAPQAPARVVTTANTIKADINKIDVNAPEPAVIKEVKKVVADVKKMQQELNSLRSWREYFGWGGYSQEQRNKAKKLADPLITEHAILLKEITDLRTLRTTDISEAKDLEIYQLIQEKRNRIKQLEPALAEYEIIIGERLSTAMKVARGAMVAAAVTLGAIVANSAYNQYSKKTQTILNNSYQQTKKSIPSVEDRNAWLAGAADIGFSGATLEKRDVSEKERELLTEAAKIAAGFGGAYSVGYKAGAHVAAKTGSKIAKVGTGIISGTATDVAMEQALDKAHKELNEARKEIAKRDTLKSENKEKLAARRKELAELKKASSTTQTQLPKNIRYPHPL